MSAYELAIAAWREQGIRASVPEEVQIAGNKLAALLEDEMVALAEHAPGYLMERVTQYRERTWRAEQANEGLRDQIAVQQHELETLRGKLAAAHQIAYEVQSLTSRYTRLYGAMGNGDRVADLLSTDTYTLGTKLRELTKGDAS